MQKELPPPLSPERRAEVINQIGEQETVLRGGIAQLHKTTELAGTKASQAEHALEADPNALKPKLTLQRINEAYGSARNKINTISRRLGYATAGLFGATLFAREAAREAYEKVSSYDMSNTNFDEVGHIWSNIADATMYSNGATALGAVGMFAIGHAINKYRKNKQESKSSQGE